MPFRKIVYLLTIKDDTEIPKGHYHIKKNGVKSQHATYQLGNGKILQIPGNDGKMHPISTAESDEMTVMLTEKVEVGQDYQVKLVPCPDVDCEMCLLGKNQSDEVHNSNMNCENTKEVNAISKRKPEEHAKESVDETISKTDKEVRDSDPKENMGINLNSPNKVEDILNTKMDQNREKIDQGGKKEPCMCPEHNEYIKWTIPREEILQFKEFLCEEGKTNLVNNINKEKLREPRSPCNQEFSDTNIEPPLKNVGDELLDKRDLLQSLEDPTDLDISHLSENIQKKLLKFWRTIQKQF